MAFRGSLVDIRLFIAAYEERSFTAAAQRENTSQSGVSHHIKQIEQLLDVTMFVRERYGVIATPAADQLYQEWVPVLRGVDRAAANMEKFTEGKEGQFTIALTPVLTQRAVAPALLQFREQHPNVRVRIIEGVTDQMPHMIRNQQVDVAISSVYEGDPAIRARQLIETQECLVTRLNSPVHQSLDNGDPVNLVLPVLRERRRAAILDSLRAQGLEIGSILEIDSGFAILDLISRSNWVTVSPSLILDPDSEERLELRPLRRGALTYRLIALEPASGILPTGAHEFIDLLTREATRVIDRWHDRFDRLGI